MAKRVSTALDNGQMPSSMIAPYLIRMEQQSLPPGTADLPIHHPSTIMPTTTTMTSTAAGTMLQPYGSAGGGGGGGGRHHHASGKACGICACSACTLCTLCIILSFAIGIVCAVVLVFHPWSTTVEYHDDGYNEHNDGTVEWMTPFPSASPP